MQRPRASTRRRQFLALAAGGVLQGATAPPARAAPPPGRHPAARGGLEENVTRYGAIGDGKTLCTEAIQKAIDACSAAGGGTVLVPPGRYLSGALFLRSHIDLHLAAGATLTASERPADFPPIKGRDEGIERTVHSSLLTGIDLEGVSISGQGLLDGKGESWWKTHDLIWKMRLAAKLPREADNPAEAPLRWPRPRTVNLIRCRDVVIAGVSLKDAAFYDLHLLYCQDVMVDGLSIRRLAGQGSGINGAGTGIAVDSCNGVRISRCQVGPAGSGIGLKSGYNEDGRRVGIPCQNIQIRQCHFSRCGDAIVVGSETAGGIRNVAISGCIIDDCRGGINVRSPRGRGGVVEHLRVSDLLFDRVGEAGVRVTNFFDSVRLGVMKGGSARRDLEISRSRSAPVDEGTPTFRDFVFSGLTMGRVGQVALIEGLPERHVRRIVLEDITASESGGGISCSMAAEVRIANLTMGAMESAAVDARDVERLEVHRLSCARPRDDAPVVWLENVAGAFIHGCGVSGTAPGYQWVRQDQCQRVTLAANDT
jgi:hypothetical protein